MSLANVHFPPRRLTRDDVKNYQILTGVLNTPTGGYEPSRTGTQELLKVGRVALRDNPRLLETMKTAMHKTLVELGAENSTGTRLFVAGALFVSAVYQFENSLPQLEVKDEALSTVCHGDSMNLVYDGCDNLRQKDIELHGLINGLIPILDPGQERTEIPFIGANVLHQVLVDSHLFTPSQTLQPEIPDELQAFEADESMRELIAMFQGELG